MKIKMLVNVKYATEKYLYAGVVYDLESALPEDMRHALESAAHDSTVAQTAGTVPMPETDIDSVVGDVEDEVENKEPAADESDYEPVTLARRV